MTKKNSKNTIKVAVYGTLLSDCPNNHYLKNTNLLGEFWTEPNLRMYALGTSYPYILKDGHSSVKMEVYGFEDDDIASKLDRLEGVSSGLYKRDKINTPFGEAIYYVRTSKINDHDLKIINGDWKDFKITGI